MKVLLVMGTSAGGVGAHVRGLARLLAGAGHHVVVACPAEAAERFRLVEHATPVPLEVTDRPHPARDARAVRDLAELVRGADVVHAHGLRAGALAVLANARTGVPLVTTLHNAAPTGRLTGTVYAGLERVAVSDEAHETETYARRDFRRERSAPPTSARNASSFGSGRAVETCTRWIPVGVTA